MGDLQALSNHSNDLTLLTLYVPIYDEIKIEPMKIMDILGSQITFLIQINLPREKKSACGQKEVLLYKYYENNFSPTIFHNRQKLSRVETIIGLPNKEGHEINHLYAKIDQN